MFNFKSLGAGASDKADKKGEGKKPAASYHQMLFGSKKKRKGLAHA